MGPAHAHRLPLVELSKITKRFPGVTAAADVDLTCRAGEVHVLLGENGAGKSTLVSLLSGLQQPDSGVIRVDGRLEIIAAPRRALALGIGAVFQHPMLVPTLSVVDTMALGGPWWRRPDRPGLAARIKAIGHDLGMAIDPSAIVGSLSLGGQQQVEILRALLRGSRLLILDEATAMLTPKGAEDLGALMRRLVGRGLAVVFITHKLNEALDYGDRISVLRAGRKVGEIGPAELKAASDRAAISAAILRLMFGAAPAEPEPALELGPQSLRDSDGAILSISGLAVADPHMPVAGIDLRVSSGEILGIAGIDGNGQKQLAEAVAGQRPAAAGSIRLDGRRIDDLDVAGRHDLGLRYVTDDRLGEGTVGAFPVSINLLLKRIGAGPFWTWGVARPAAIAAHARRLVAEFDVRTPGIDTPIGALSGGNIQKALLARELSGPIRALVLAKPTHGLDVRTTGAIRRRLHETRATGVATILISTDLEELLELSDRIAVMAHGRLVGTVANDADARQHVAEMLSGVAA